MGGRKLKSLILSAPDEAAMVLGLEPESDEAARVLQAILDELDWQEKWSDGKLDGCKGSRLKERDFSVEFIQPEGYDD